MNKLFVVGSIVAGLTVLALLAKSAKAVPHPDGTANITAIITLDKVTCSGACTVNGVITYTNGGNAAGTVTPAVSANGVIQVIATQQTLQPGDAVNVSFSQPVTATTSFCPVIGS